MKGSGSWGVRLLGLWLVLQALLPLLNLRLPNSSTLLAVLAIVAGVLLLVNR